MFLCGFVEVALFSIGRLMASKVTLLSKRNSYDLEDSNEFLREAVGIHWELDRVSGWEKLV